MAFREALNLLFPSELARRSVELEAVRAEHAAAQARENARRAEEAAAAAGESSLLPLSFV